MQFGPSVHAYWPSLRKQIQLFIIPTGQTFSPVSPNPKKTWTERPNCTRHRQFHGLKGQIAQRGGSRAPGRFFGPSGCAAQPSSSRLCPTKLHPSNFLCFPLRCHSMYQPAPPRTPPPSCRSCRPSPRCLRDAHASVVELSEDPLAPPWVHRTSSGTRLGPRFCLRSRDDS